MRIRNFVIAVFVLALAIPGFASAQGETYWTTGGGQVIASSNTPGPGDTIAWVARVAGGVIGETDDDGNSATPGEDIYAANGQLQVVDRSEGGGRDQIIYHGNVTCIVPRGDNTTRFGGTGRDPRTKVVTDFVVDLTDASDQGDDMVKFDQLNPGSSDPAEPCEEESQTQLRTTTLARGNAKIHDRR